MDLENIIGHVNRPSTDFYWENRIAVIDENKPEFNGKYDLGITFIDGLYIALIIDNETSLITKELTVYAREKYNFYEILKNSYDISDFDELLDKEYERLTNE